MKFRKLENEDLYKNIIGKHIKDSNREDYVKIIGRTDDEYLPIMCVVVEGIYDGYGHTIDDDMLLRDFDIEDDE